MLKIVIQQIENGYEVVNWSEGAREGAIGKIYAFPDWNGVRDFLKEPPFREDRVRGQQVASKSSSGDEAIRRG